MLVTATGTTRCTDDPVLGIPVCALSLLAPHRSYPPDSAARSPSSPRQVSSLSRHAGLAATSVSAAAAQTQHGAVSAGDDAGLPAAMPAQLNSAAVRTHSPILFAASVRRCVSSPALSLSAPVSDNDGDVLMRPTATAAAVVLHPARPSHAVLTDAAAAAAAGAAALDVHTVRVDASASPPDAAMMTADADADAELLLGQSDCKGDASVLLVSTSARSADDSGDDDMSVMTDVDADCSAEADASRQQRQCVDLAEAELSSVSVRIAAVGAPAAVTMARRSRGREGGSRGVATVGG